MNGNLDHNLSSVSLSESVSILQSPYQQQPGYFIKTTYIDPITQDIMLQISADDRLTEDANRNVV